MEHLLWWHMDELLHTDQGRASYVLLEFHRLVVKGSFEMQYMMNHSQEGYCEPLLPVKDVWVMMEQWPESCEH